MIKSSDKNQYVLNPGAMPLAILLSPVGAKAQAKSMYLCYPFSGKKIQALKGRYISAWGNALGTDDK